MTANLAGILGAIAAGLAVVSSVLYYVLKWKELQVLRDIRDRLPKAAGK